MPLNETPHENFLRTPLRAALYFCSCELVDVALSAFYYSPVLTRWRIFLQLSTALSLDTDDNLRSLGLLWHTVAYNE